MKLIVDIEKTLMLYGSDIILSANMQSQKQYIQHGSVSVFEHCISVACLCIYIASRLHIKINERALVRGALLHDYFLYDWHVSDPSHRLHGFKHAKFALNNASRDFDLNHIERDIIKKHMFPLNIAPPKYKESIIVCIADKICATCETLSIDYLKVKTKYDLMEI